jgi:hypothetical protein
MTTPDERWPDGQPVTPWADPWHDVMADLRAVGQFVRPLAPEEIECRTQLYREAGMLDRQVIARVLLGEFD